MQKPECKRKNAAEMMKGSFLAAFLCIWLFSLLIVRAYGPSFPSVVFQFRKAAADKENVSGGDDGAAKQILFPAIGYADLIHLLL